MQKIKIGHRANFRAKNKCFRQILFPVRAILRSINFRYADFNTDSADACILVMACVLARALAALNVVVRSEFKLKPEQEVAVMSLQDGKDVLAVLPTGYGKSLIYQMCVCAKDFEIELTNLHDFYGS